MLEHQRIYIYVYIYIATSYDKGSFSNNSGVQNRDSWAVPSASSMLLKNLVAGPKNTQTDGCGKSWMISGRIKRLDPHFSTSKARDDSNIPVTILVWLRDDSKIIKSEYGTREHPRYTWIIPYAWLLRRESQGLPIILVRLRRWLAKNG